MTGLPTAGTFCPLHDVTVLPSFWLGSVAKLFEAGLFGFRRFALARALPCLAFTRGLAFAFLLGRWKFVFDEATTEFLFV